MELFNLQKKQTLEKMHEHDKSRKGFIDAHIENLCSLINKKENYYTTSSCSGRILLLEIPNDAKKHEIKWILASHDKVDEKELLDKIHQKTENEIWFRQEAFIMHIAAKDIHAAQVLVHRAKDLGLKRTGIISLNNKIIVEIIYHLQIYTIIKQNEEVLVSDNYLKILLEKANQNMELNFLKIKELEKEIEKL